MSVETMIYLCGYLKNATDKASKDVGRIFCEPIGTWNCNDGRKLLSALRAELLHHKQHLVVD